MNFQEETTLHRAPVLAQEPTRGGAQLDSAHAGDIRGGFATIHEHDAGPRKNWWARFKTLLAILGPGLIVMVGDNDAGAFGTYTQAGQNYGTTLLWTLLMLIPVLYVNQEMVLRLGAVTGVGHARLILERFGKFWGAFSVIDLFVLNALTIVTEFIGLTFPSFLPRVRALIASCALAFAGLSFSSPATAEDTPGVPPLAPGVRVRIVAPDVSAGKVIGTITAVDEESVTLNVPGRSAPVSMPRDKITHLDVSEGPRSRWINAAFGAAAGALGGAIVGGNHKSSLFHSDYSTGEAATDGGVLGALVGAAVGALIPPGERWISGGEASYRVSLAPQFQHGLGVAVAVKF